MAESAQRLVPYSLELNIRGSKPHLPSDSLDPYCDISSISPSESVSAPIGTIFTAAILMFIAMLMITLGIFKQANNDSAGVMAFVLFGGSLMLPGIALSYKAVRMISSAMSAQINLVSYRPVRLMS